jgi:sugar phosphate isomerase/epimerase
MTQHVQLLGSYWTLAVGADPMGEQRCLHDFRVRVETAAKAGFTAMGFWHADIAETLKKYSFREMKRILDDNGITQVEVEWLLDWFCTDQRRVASDDIRKLLLDAAEGLAARHIKIGDLGNDCADVPAMSEEFGVLCRQAAERGTNVLFEMLPAPFSRAPSLDQVLAICSGCGAKNGGIMLDNLHLQRTGTPSEDIVRKIARDIPLGVEINDGALAVPLNLHDSVVNKRLLPGDGEFDIAAFLQALWTQGYDGPVGVEVLNEYIRRWPLETAAREAFVKTKQVVTSAREKWEAERASRTSP